MRRASVPSPSPAPCAGRRWRRRSPRACRPRGGPWASHRSEDRPESQVDVPASPPALGDVLECSATGDHQLSQSQRIPEVHRGRIELVTHHQSDRPHGGGPRDPSTQAHEGAVERVEEGKAFLGIDEACIRGPDPTRIHEGEGVVGPVPETKGELELQGSVPPSQSTQRPQPPSPPSGRPPPGAMGDTGGGRYPLEARPPGPVAPRRRPPIRGPRTTPRRSVGPPR